MHENGYRQNGGIGFAIDKPSATIAIEPSKELHIIDHRTNGFGEEEYRRVTELIKTLIGKNAFGTAIKAHITGDIPTHMGFGSSTAIRLGLIEALYRANDREYTPSDIVTASGRGGVSGIGVETYFYGGLVMDIGRSVKIGFAPSSSMEQTSKPKPLLIHRSPMPAWEVGICIPDINPKSEEEERDFFRRTCPIKESESHRVLYHALYGVVGSVIETDYDTFCTAIRNIQQCEWKAAERSLYGDELIAVEKALYASGADAVGMSSLGPSLFFFAQDMGTVVTKAKTALPSADIFKTHFNNTGRRITDG
jgi:beta-ribofuranosylaminobenzene 5'-phosphate synthase